MAPLRTEKLIRTEQEMFPLIESWLKSKLTQKEFSQKHQLPLHILPYWIGRYRNAHPIEHAPPSNTAPFIQLTPSAASAEPTPTPDPITPVTSPAANQIDAVAERTPPESTVVGSTGNSAMEMEVAFPSGVKIHFSSLVPVTYLKELVSVCFR